MSAFLILLTLSLTPALRAQAPEYGTATLEAGSMRLHISRGGQVAPLQQDGTLGLQWPGAPTSATLQARKLRQLLFTATPLLVGRKRGVYEASGNYFKDNYLPGPILPGMRTVNPRDPRYRAFVIRIGDESAQDFLEWPHELGAPVDSVFAPLFYGSPQMYWVMNDLDTAAMRKNMGSFPMGVELRCLAWPLSTVSGLGDDAVLLQMTWINQSPDSIRDAYAGFFTDPDVRHATDDAVGSDSTLALGYVYDDNLALDLDGMPTAFGLCMLQTPAVPGAPTDSARWRNGMKRGFRNIPVTAVTVPSKHGPNTPTNFHPAREPMVDEGGEVWHTFMQGNPRGATALNPLTGTPSRFWFNGDPVSGSGWLPDDGYLFDNGERYELGRRDQRLLISSGPFDLAPGDTQQVVIALIAARGATAEAAVHMLRDRASFLRQHHLRRGAVSGFSAVSLRHDPRTGGGSDLRFTARSSSEADGVDADITASDGSSVTRFPLSAIRQGSETLYTGSVSLPEGRDGVNAGFIVRDGSEEHRLPGRVSIPTAGAVQSRGAAILQEYDGNGRIAPDEEARWMPRLYNSASRAMDLRIAHPTLDYSEWMHVTGLPATSTVPSAQFPWRPDFGSRGVPAGTAGWGTDFDSTFFEYDAWENATNSWWQLRNWVQVDSTAGEWFDLLMTRVRSGSAQLPGVILEDITQLRDRCYLARITDGDGTRLLSLYDSTSGERIFADYALDRFNGMAPVTDGFRVVRGTIGSRFTGYFFENVTGLDPTALGMNPVRAGHSNFEEEERREFRLEFTLEGREYWHYAERGYEGRVRLPLRASMRDAAGEWTPVQVALHESGTDIPDGAPNPDGGDYLMLYQLPYDAEASPEVSILPVDVMEMPAPLLLELKIMPTEGMMDISYPVPVTAGDVFSFNPRHLLVAQSNKPATAATLHPPAPMPFRDWTSALIELQQPGALRVEVYNALGQRVRVLFDGLREAGKHLLVWDGYWEDGRPAETGAYLLRAVTGGREITRKLLRMR
ncbi:MAG: FlgD immunoglobulin-like domain containing protein [Bacteroidota bacterium]|nr:FlgD immunoglobulin-like domain containing protein [Bacteroidota bacterium]